MVRPKRGEVSGKFKWAPVAYVGTSVFPASSNRNVGSTQSDVRVGAGGFFFTLGKMVGECSSLFTCILCRRVIKGWRYQMHFPPIHCAGLGALLIKRTDNTAYYMMMKNRVCWRMTNCNDNEGIQLHTSGDTKEHTINMVMIYNCKE